jgi:hypothetical protein
MQSYTLYTTSEFLKDRHPYIPDPNPRPLMDPEQVSIAYNERAVPKLSDLLIYKELSSDKRLAALHTLNELVSHQETKCDMINNGIVKSATNLMEDKNADVRFEASFLVGSLLFLDVGRKKFDSEKINYEIMQKLIFDEVTKVRESVGWLLYRLSLHKDGTLMMNESNTISQMVLAFNKYSSSELIEENVIYLLYLLEAIINCSRYDYNIRQTLGRGLLNSFNKILDDYNQDFSSKLSKGLYRQMRELILSACKNITLTFDGKKEAYKENLIITCSKFLNSPLEKERLYTSSMFMSVTNILGAKNQICDFTDAEKYKEKMERRKQILNCEFPEEAEKKIISEQKEIKDFAYSDNSIHYEILEKICALLNKDENYDIRENAKLCLQNLSNLPEGFIKIIDILHDKLELMDEVFGVDSLKGLTDLLPKLSTYKNPPNVEKKMLSKYTKVIKGIIYFYEKYQEEALEILIHKTVNINEKLAPFYILNDPIIYKLAKYLTDRIGKKDTNNQKVLQDFFEKYGFKEKKGTNDALDSNQIKELFKN